MGTSRGLVTVVGRIAPWGPRVGPLVVAPENAVTGASFRSATGPFSVFGEGALASANEVPVTAFSLALRSSRRPTVEPPERTSGTYEALRP